MDIFEAARTAGGRKEPGGCLMACVYGFGGLAVLAEVGVVGFVLWAIYKLLQYNGII